MTTLQSDEQGGPDMTIRVGRNVLDAPKISVVIPAYNSAKYISETLESVKRQKFRESEIIVVNDGSPDTSAFEREINLHLEDIVYIYQKNAGAGVARNTGIGQARGELIAFLDADDIWLPDYLSSQYIYLQRNSLDMVYCDAQLFGLNTAYRRTFMETAPSAGEADFESILDLRCNVITSGTLVKKAAVLVAGGFETERVRAHDVHLWLRIARTGAKIGYQKKVLLKYRVHIDSLSGDAVSRAERELDAFRRVKDTIDMSEAELNIVERRIRQFSADLYVEKGKSALLSGNGRQAAADFRAANLERRSFKLGLIAAAAAVAPSVLRRIYVGRRRDELAMAEKHQ